MVKAALVLEGGALRSVYTAGVLDIFMEKNIYFKYVLGVSAGSLTAANYISKQPGRSASINLEHTKDPNYYGLHCFVRKHSIFNFDYIFDKPINESYPFDEETFINSQQEFVAVATDCETGQAVYLQYSYEKLITILQASSSMPLLSPMVTIDGRNLLDGGISDPVPIKKAQQEGYNKIVVVLTRHQGFRKCTQSFMLSKLYQTAYYKYPKLLNRLLDMPAFYNKCMDRIEELERKGEIFVIRPQKPVVVSRAEKNKKKLTALYEEGLEETLQILDKLEDYLKK